MSPTAGTTYWLERAWLGSGGVLDGVLVTVEGSRFADVRAGEPQPPAGVQWLPGLTIPGLANCHSHAFHRALRGRTQRERGNFWSWREQMYALAGTLTPDGYHRLAREVFSEMAATGITMVGEFHYLHHGPDGSPYGDANAMGEALVQAARDAGIRIALLDTCYLAGGIGRPAEGAQLRFSDGTADAWGQRLSDLADTHAHDGDVVVGAAIHSVRAVPRDELPLVAKAAAGRPLHVHVSEQVAENEQCEAAYGMSPTRLLDEAGVLGPRTSVVHATRVFGDDVRLIGGSRTFTCLCPTTERDLGDGIGLSRALHAAGSPLTLGSDSHAVVDLFEEMRAVEMGERLATRERGHWSAAELLTAATGHGATSLGFPDAGRIEAGAWADLVTLDTRSVRTAGTGAALETAVFGAGAADVVQTVSGGTVVFTREEAGEIGARLDSAVNDVWERA